MNGDLTDRVLSPKCQFLAQGTNPQAFVNDNLASIASIESLEESDRLIDLTGHCP
jgi:hypothetical protein